MGAVWGITSVTCIPVSEMLDRVNMVLISPGCTNPKVTDRGLKNVNRTCARDDAQGPAGAMFAVQDLKAKKIAMFDDGTTGPKGAADEVEKGPRRSGPKPHALCGPRRRQGLPRHPGHVPKDVDVIYASLWAPEAALIAKQLPDVGLGSADDRPGRTVRAGGLHPGLGRRRRGQLRDVPRPGHEEGSRGGGLREGVRGEVRDAVSSYGPLAYEAANIILEAVKKAGKADRAAIRDAVRATKNYKGMLGVPISFDDKGDVAGGVIFVYQVKGQGFEQIKTIVVK